MLKNGTDISVSEAVYLNESGEYLLDSHTLGKIATATSGGYSSIDRRGLTHFLVRIGSGAIERRSETMDMQIFLSVLLYAAGALQLFLPQELAFFGSRWLFRNEPELSDSGRAAMLIGGGVVMVFAIIILFIGL